MKDAHWPELTTKQADFVRAFLVDGNATQAAIQAGYSRKTAASVGHENLRKPQIASRIDAERDRAARDAAMEVDEIARRLSWLARTDPADFFDVTEAGVTLKPTGRLTEAQRYALREAQQTVTETGGSVRVKIADPKPALDTLAKWRGMLVTKHEHSGPEGGPIQTETADLSRLSKDQLRQLAVIRKVLDAER